MINLNDNNKKMKAEKIANAIISIAEHNGMPYHELQTEALRMTIKQELDRYASTKAEEVAKRAFIAGSNYSCDVPTKCMVTTSDELEASDDWYTQYKLSQI